MKDINATIIVNLKPSEEEIMEGLHKDARWGVRRAIKEGLIVEELKNNRDWKEIYEIYKNTIKAGGATPDSIEKIKKDTKVLFLCKYKNKIIAFAGIELNENVPTLYIAGSVPEYRNLQPNNLLYWNCILWCKKKGFKKLDLGGWQINAREHLQGVNKFKEKWGEKIYFKRDYPFHKAVGRKIIRNSNFFWWLNKKIRERK